MKKNKIFFAIILLIFCLTFVAGTTLALEIKSYPKIPGLVEPSSNCSGSGCLSVYIGYFLGILIYIAAFISLISFVIGAIGLINPNVSAHTDAKDRMKSAVLGLVLTMASIVIIKTINPRLVDITLNPVAGVKGIYYTDGKENRPAPLEESDITNVEQGFRKLLYLCSGENGQPDQNQSEPPNLLIWMFPEKDFSLGNGGYNDVKVEKLSCSSQGGGGGIALTGKSFRMAYQTPGVYFCMGGCKNDKMCDGLMSDVITGSQTNIPEPFGDMKGIMVVSNPQSQTAYGAIIHQSPQPDMVGQCVNEPILNVDAEEVCKPINGQVGSVDIFRVNTSPKTSGSGVTFYSEENGWLSGRQAGFFELSGESISAEINPLDPSEMEFSYNGITRLDEYKEKYKYFSDHPRSIRLNGSYILGLQSDSGDCQTFTQKEINLAKTTFNAFNPNSPFTMYVIPIK